MSPIEYNDIKAADTSIFSDISNYVDFSHDQIKYEETPMNEKRYIESVIVDNETDTDFYAHIP